MTPDQVRKVASIVLRDGPSGRELLVFDHPVEQGGVMVQVPAGTIEPGELPGRAAVRECLEETGVEAELLELVGARDEEFAGESRRRWVFVLQANGTTQREWPFNCDCGIPVRCYWVPLEQATVVEPQQAWVDMAREWLLLNSLKVTP